MSYYTELAERLRQTQSRSKRRLLDEAALALTALEENRNAWQCLAEELHGRLEEVRGKPQRPEE